MIESKEDLERYLRADAAALGVSSILRASLTDDIFRFQRRLRKMEYLVNCRRAWLRRKLCAWLMNRLGTKLGFSIPINVFGPGLSIAHRGTIVINSKVRIGANCRIHVCTNIGDGFGNSPGIPVIGDRCYIAPGAKIFGGIHIGDDTVIGANAVVNRSFPQGGVTIAGVPAKVIGPARRHTAGD